MIFRPRFCVAFKKSKPWSVPYYLCVPCVSPIICAYYLEAVAETLLGGSYGQPEKRAEIGMRVRRGGGGESQINLSHFASRVIVSVPYVLNPYVLHDPFCFILLILLEPCYIY
jgi:hypothetical protein